MVHVKIIKLLNEQWIIPKGEFVTKLRETKWRKSVMYLYLVFGIPSLEQ